MKQFNNREISLLQFQMRVLEEAFDETNPLLERAKFVAIVCSNLDEFYMIRMGGLVNKIAAQIDKKDNSNLTPIEVFNEATNTVQQIYQDIYFCYSNLLVPQLQENGISFIKREQYTEEDRRYLQTYFYNLIFPVLTPMVHDQSRPFPLVQSKTLNLGMLIEHNHEVRLGIVELPTALDRIIELPSTTSETRLAFLEDVVMEYIHSLFGQVNIHEITTFRITRYADLELEEDAADLLLEVKQSLTKRMHGNIIRLEINQCVSPHLLKLIKEEIDITDKGILYFNGPLDLSLLFEVQKLKGYQNFRYHPIQPLVPEGLSSEDDLFANIKKQDYFIHTPFHSFDPVIHLLEQAASDPNVIAIKQTLYRVSNHSPIVKALAKAAQNGKQVTVLVELKARFDEANNIHWAERLEKSGCRVIYGIVGLKIHCKLLMVVRREQNSVTRYVHLGTGNYNEMTAKLYTDLGIFTADPVIGEDVTIIFNMLSGAFIEQKLQKLTIAPYGLREKLFSLIDQEIKHVECGGKGKLVAKMNSLIDHDIMEKLYEASQKGVQIELIVRGICGIVPGIPGISENIKVRSIVGQFLEHTRIFHFYNNGADQVYIASADWMERNFDRRVETFFLIENEQIRKHLIEILNLYLLDNTKAQLLQSDKKYHHQVASSTEKINAQNLLWKKYAKQNKKKQRQIQLPSFMQLFIKN